MRYIDLEGHTNKVYECWLIIMRVFMEKLLDLISIKWT